MTHTLRTARNLAPCPRPPRTHLTQGDSDLPLLSAAPPLPSVDLGVKIYPYLWVDSHGSCM